MKDTPYRFIPATVGTPLLCAYLINLEYAVDFQLVYGIIPHSRG